MRFLGFVVVSAAMMLGACGGGDKAADTMADSTTVAAPAMDAPAPAAGAAQAITGMIHEVKMVGDATFRYEPAEITIKAGDGIKFIMVSGAPHNVAFDATLLPADVKTQLMANMPNQMSELSSPMMMNANEEYTLSFAGVAPGTYEFFCTPHLAMGMKGKVTVTP